MIPRDEAIKACFAQIEAHLLDAIVEVGNGLDGSKMDATGLAESLAKAVAALRDAQQLALKEPDPPPESGKGALPGVN